MNVWRMISTYPKYRSEEQKLHSISPDHEHPKNYRISVLLQVLLQLLNLTPEEKKYLKVQLPRRILSLNPQINMFQPQQGQNS